MYLPPLFPDISSTFVKLKSARKTITIRQCIAIFITRIKVHGNAFKARQNTLLYQNPLRAWKYHREPMYQGFFEVASLTLSGNLGTNLQEEVRNREKKTLSFAASRQRKPTSL